MTPFSNNIYIILSSTIYGPYFDNIFLGRKFIMIFVDNKMYANKNVYKLYSKIFMAPFFTSSICRIRRAHHLRIRDQVLVPQVHIRGHLTGTGKKGNTERAKLYKEAVILYCIKNCKLFLVPFRGEECKMVLSASFFQ